jgi:hypothetical protein
VVYTGGKENQTAPSRNIVDMNLATLSSGVLSQLLGHKTSGTARPLNVC